MKKISAVYKITNTVTGDFYIGSSKNIKQKWSAHKCISTWNRHPNSHLYQDMKKYGIDKFEFQILAEVEPEHLKEVEQQFIEKMHPIYNSNRANGLDVEKWKKYMKEYLKSNKYKEYLKEYKKSDKYKETHRKANKEYYQKKSDKYKKYHKEYDNQLCLYNGEKMTLAALKKRFQRAGIEHSTIEAKKYLIKKEPENAIESYDIYP